MDHYTERKKLIFMIQEKLWTTEFISMGGSNFFQFMSQYIMVAALPVFIMGTLGGGEVEAGLAMTFFQIGTVCCRPLAGHWIDSINKRKLMLGTTIGFFLVMTAFSFASSLASILVLRLLHGILFALGTTVASAMAALILPASRKGEGIGYFAVSTNLAMVVGPIIGLLLVQQWGAKALFGFLAVLAVLTIGISNYKKLPDEITMPSLKKQSGWHLQDFIEKHSVPMAFFGGLVYFAYGGILTFIPLYASSLGMSTATSLFFMLFAIVIVLTRPFVGRIFDRKGADFIVYPGFLSFITGLIIFSKVQTMTGLLISAAILGIGFGALSPAFQTLAIQSAPLERAGVATATYFWSLDISVGLAAVLLGIVIGKFGYSVMYGVFSAGVMILAAGLYFVWRLQNKKE